MSFFKFLERGGREQTFEAALEQGGASKEVLGGESDLGQDRLLRLERRREELKVQLTGRAFLDVALHPHLSGELAKIEKEIEKLQIAMQAAAWSEGGADQRGGAPSQAMMGEVQRMKD